MFVCVTQEWSSGRHCSLWGMYDRALESTGCVQILNHLWTNVWVPSSQIYSSLLNDSSNTDLSIEKWPDNWFLGFEDILGTSNVDFILHCH